MRNKQIYEDNLIRNARWAKIKFMQAVVKLK